MSAEDRAVVAAYRAARDRARWQFTWRLRWQLAHARRRSDALATDMAESAVLAAICRELQARGVHVQPVRPG